MKGLRKQRECLIIGGMLEPVLSCFEPGRLGPVLDLRKDPNLLKLDFAHEHEGES